MSFSPTSRKPSKVACRSMSPRRKAAAGAFSKSRYDIGFRPGAGAPGRAPRLDAVAGESHHIYGKPGSVVRLSIPIHGNTALKLGLLRHLLKLAEIDEGEL
jgi:HicA toxin of bacterial toxin-antitoxin,